MYYRLEERRCQVVNYASLKQFSVIGSYKNVSVINQLAISKVFKKSPNFTVKVLNILII